MWGLIGALVALAVYIYVCILAVLYVAAPLALLGLAGGLVGGLGVATAATVLTLAGQRPQARVITPDAVVAGAVGGREKIGLERRDRAWPTYFAGQARCDLTAALGWTAELVGRAWSASGRATAFAVEETEGWLLVAWPLFIPLLALLLALSLGAALGAAAIATVFAGVTVTVWTPGVLVAFMLRGVDRVWQRTFRAAGSCPNTGCYWVSALPVFRCLNDACPELHRDIRPSRLGVLWRRCGCGQRMPTTVLRSTKMRAVCPKCNGALRPGAAVATDIRLPVFGATMAGKTRFIMAGLVGLIRLADNDGIRVSATDPDSERMIADYIDVIARQVRIDKTSPGVLPVAVSVQLEVGRRTALIHLFDAAGELFVDREQNAKLAYLDHARALVFVLDPFSIPDLRVRLAGFDAELLDTTASHDPEGSYHVTVQRLRNYGVATRRMKLAFVLSKADLLRSTPVVDGLPTSSVEVRPWLHQVGLDNLLHAAERDFAQVRYFLVSAMHAEPQQETSALAPLRWLLATDGIRLDLTRTM
jgi:hypothetical protein